MQNEMDRNDRILNNSLLAMDMPAGVFDFGDLDEHFLQCETCQEDVCIYDRIFSEISMLPTLEAPEGFELSVMARITEIRASHFAVEVRIWDKARSSLVGTIMLFVGAGSVYAFFKEPIWLALTHNGLNGQLTGIVDTVRATAVATSTILAKSTRLLVGFLATIVALQAFLLTRKDKNHLLPRSKGERR